MPKPASFNVQTALVANFSPDNGYQIDQSLQRFALPNSIVQNPPILLGVDYVTQEFQVGSTTITFPNLPIRGSNNPSAQVQNQPQNIVIPLGSLLLYEVTTSSGALSVTTSILDTSKLSYDQAAVGPGEYKTFQAQVTSGTIETATVWAKLYLCLGATKA